jgi:hypothetical protein
LCQAAFEARCQICSVLPASLPLSSGMEAPPLRSGHPLSLLPMMMQGQ